MCLSAIKNVKFLVFNILARNKQKRRTHTQWTEARCANIRSLLHSLRSTKVLCYWYRCCSCCVCVYFFCSLLYFFFELFRETYWTFSQVQSETLLCRWFRGRLIKQNWHDKSDRLCIVPHVIRFAGTYVAKTDVIYTFSLALTKASLLPGPEDSSKGIFAHTNTVKMWRNHNMYRIDEVIIALGDEEHFAHTCTQCAQTAHVLYIKP